MTKRRWPCVRGTYLMSLALNGAIFYRRCCEAGLEPRAAGPPGRSSPPVALWIREHWAEPGRVSLDLVTAHRF